MLLREYDTPSGPLRHAVRRTGEDPGEGWVVQPDQVPLIEDFNIPRAVQHLVSEPGAGARRGPPVPGTRPDQQAGWFRERHAAACGAFAREQGGGRPGLVGVRHGRGGLVHGGGRGDLPGHGPARGLRRAVRIVTRADARPHRAGRRRSGRGPDRGARLVLLHRPVVPGRCWTATCSRTSPSCPPSPIATGKKFAYVMTTGVADAGRAARRRRGGRAVLRGPGAGRPVPWNRARDAVRRAHHPGRGA